MSMSNNWISNKPELLPDFIIGGAMKCATSSLNYILNSHPDIYIPNRECHFFDIDNILQHSNYNYYKNNHWIRQSMRKNPKKMWEWYFKKFKDRDSKIIGEDSTTYLASRIAAERISSQKKQIKMIFLLRQPSLRAYSNYLHLLRTNKAIYSFEDTIRYQPHKIIFRSLYKDQLQDYYDLFPPERIKVVLFEDLVENKKHTLSEVCSFLNIDYNLFDISKIEKSHKNKSFYPKYINLHLLKNKLINYEKFQTKDLPTKLGLDKKSLILLKTIKKLFGYFNPIISKPPPINQKTKIILDDFFYDNLKGIDEIVGKEILSKWFH